MAINAIKSSEGEFIAVTDKGKQVEATECNPIPLTHDNIRIGSGLGPPCEESNIFVGDKKVKAQNENPVNHMISCGPIGSRKLSLEESMSLSFDNQSNISSLTRDSICKPRKRSGDGVIDGKESVQKKRKEILAYE
ncbi:hypothetical protein LWI28_007061 [Acer negundo]|uniref:Uncharacterized protein n=1 Tax=Acer negundo TaxID=4023 RepID=A0AAD5IG24_ACENE|nr:hypothetical protein LWI28_007061 [Acer negundo]KAK4836885.1 hypothetical protein QYF36_001042 [Acer negundo]